MTAAIRRTRVWFQFRLQSLVAFVGVAGCAFGLIAWKLETKRRERHIVAALRRLGGDVRYNWERSPVHAFWRPRGAPGAEAPGPRFLRAVLGDDFFGHPTYLFLPPSKRVFAEKYKWPARSPAQWTLGPSAKDADLSLVAALTSLEELELSYTDIGDPGLAHIRHLKRLRSINLEYTNITDVGICQLDGLTSLRELCLDGTKITDSALPCLQNLRALNALALDNTAVSNRGMVAIGHFHMLEQLRLRDTKVTDEGLVQLQQLPSLRRVVLGGPKITDSGVIYLKRLRGLTYLLLQNTRMTAESVTTLHDALPECKIVQ